MRYVVTPTFSDKAVQSSGQSLSQVGKMLTEIDQFSKEQILEQCEPILESEPTIYVFRRDGVQIFLSFGGDTNGEYVLLADLTVVSADADMRPGPSRDPRVNMMIDPNRNMMIDPRRNMMIDPNRNMMIDPNRNMMIDPRRNMMIDPNRNMMIDLRRNYMIDPSRNYLLDPNRNTLINPRKNRVLAGPYQYELNLRLNGYVVRANDQVALLFGNSGEFIGSLVRAGDKNHNLFGASGEWIEFFVSNDADGHNGFDLSLRFTSFIVGAIHPPKT